MTARQEGDRGNRQPQESPPPRTTSSTPARTSTASTSSAKRLQREYLAKPVFKKLRRTIEGLEPFDPAIADAVAQGVKQWAVAHGATHYTHWFVPLTGSSRREARLVPEPDRRRHDHRRVLRASGLIQGEPDASLVPLGRHPLHLRGPRLHRLGRHQPDLPAGRAERRDPDHPHRLRLLHRRGAGPQDPAAALAGGPGQAGPAHPALVRLRHRRAASSPPSAPSRSTS